MARGHHINISLFILTNEMYPRNFRLSLNLVYAILSAVIVEFILFPILPIHDNLVNQDQLADVNNIHPDAKSAIKRATTVACKRELLQFAIKQTQELGISGTLKRSCSHDIQQPGKSHIEPLGCLTLLNNFNISSLVQIAENELINNGTLCSQNCFIYSHSYAGYNLTDHKCYCGDERLSQLIVAPELGTGSSSGNCAQTNQLEWFHVNAGIHQPKGRGYRKRNRGEIATTKPTPIRIAFLLILNGRSFLQVRRLLKMIYSEQHHYYLHVDERQQYLFNMLLPLETKHDNIIVVKKRYSTIWGGTTLLQMIIDTMRSMAKRQWNFMINLSESDLPVKPLSELELYLASEPRSNIYLRSHNMRGYSFIRKQGLNQNFYQCENRLWRLGERRLPFNIIYSGGSDWFVLPREFCDYIIGELGALHVVNISFDRDRIVLPLLDLYNHTLLPAESFFHTLALNSKYCDNFVDKNLRMTNWRRKQACKCQHKNIVDWCGCSPLVYRWSDLKRLQQTRASNELFFSRKFDPTLSSSIIAAVQHHLIDNNILLPRQSYDTRYWLNMVEFADAPQSNLESSTYFQFGLFAIKQLFGPESTNYIRYQLVSIDSYFDHDRFIGQILSYRDTGSRGCLQILVERNTSAHLKEYNDQCFKGSLHQIQVIEVNHGFDTGERTFRNFMPLNSNSNIVVYHEWTVQNQLGITSNESMDHDHNIDRRVKFQWVSPGDKVELIQMTKLRAPSLKPTRLSLAHRFNRKTPLISGKWNLSVYEGPIKCFDYQFLIFNETSFVEAIFSQVEFDNFYTVTSSCVTEAYHHDNDSHDKKQNGTLKGLIRMEHCNKSNWSLLARDEQLHSYELS